MDEGPGVPTPIRGGPGGGDATWDQYRFVWTDYSRKSGHVRSGLTITLRSRASSVRSASSISWKTLRPSPTILIPPTTATAVRICYCYYSWGNTDTVPRGTSGHPDGGWDPQGPHPSCRDSPHMDEGLVGSIEAPTQGVRGPGGPRGTISTNDYDYYQECAVEQGSTAARENSRTAARGIHEDGHA